MSSYARYCRDQAAECARRARLASSREIAANCLKLELRWIKLAERADAPNGAVGLWGRATAAVAARVLIRQLRIVATSLALRDARARRARVWKDGGGRARDYAARMTASS